MPQPSGSLTVVSGSLTGGGRWDALSRMGAQTGSVLLDSAGSTGL